MFQDKTRNDYVDELCQSNSNIDRELVSSIGWLPLVSLAQIFYLGIFIQFRVCIQVCYKGCIFLLKLPYLKKKSCWQFFCLFWPYLCTCSRHRNLQKIWIQILQIFVLIFLMILRQKIWGSVCIRICKRFLDSGAVCPTIDQAKKS